MNPIEIQMREWESPIGKIFIYTNHSSLYALCFSKNNEQIKKYLFSINGIITDGPSPLFEKIIAQLREYFGGIRKVFDLPLNLQGTLFQKTSWQELSKIPYGRILTYKEQAKLMGKERAVRAVGIANSRNPISIIIPCHRVIAQSGELQGYAGGIEIKKQLLELESSMVRYG